ncbi:MAG: succinylglutamate desuccinylase/aspartoacylase family protein [Candidatus Buchananbacteria bacterium]|nr:succinylglutamate desuccinylase/aspartoacylase family protein [Candidatus Buchananbacteria bacterium]
MTKDFIELKGKQAGPTSVILVGVHGDEKCGLLAIKKILPRLKIEEGLVLIGVGNPLAAQRNKRYIQADLNRMFKPAKSILASDKKSYEYKRAQVLKRYLKQADFLLDLHSSASRKSKPFIICQANARKIIQYLPVGLVVSGFDQKEPGGTDYYMNKIGKVGICVECGYTKDKKSTLLAEKSILNFLKAAGNIENNLTAGNKKIYFKIFQLYRNKTDNFVLKKQFADFEKINAGQIIGVDGSRQIKAKKSGLILFAHNRSQAGREAFLLLEQK